MMHHARIAQRASNTPLMVEPSKALAFLSGLGPRVAGQEITFHGADLAAGVGDGNGDPVAVSPEGIDALLDIWPLFETYQTEYVAGGLLLDQERNVSSPLPSGPSAGAMDTVRPARKPAKPARKS
jgi:hypothetical protein